MEYQTKFEGWARVEVMGHQSHIGYVVTQAFGQAVLFRIDQPAIDEVEETLNRAEWVGDVYAQPGSVVKRPAIEAASVLVGLGSIYRIIPCDEATAVAAIRSSQRRPLVPVRLVEKPRLAAPSDPFDVGSCSSDEQDEPEEETVF